MAPDSPKAGKLRCPACGYELSGLPEWHTCPECGVPYDPHSKIYNVTDAGKHLHQIGLAVLLGVMALIAFLPQFRSGHMHLKDLLDYWAILLVLSLGSIYRLMRSAGGPCRVVASHQGIRFDHPGAKPLDVSWRQFCSARFGRLTTSLNIWDQRGRQLLRRQDRYIGTPATRRKLAAELNELAKVYQVKPGAGPHENQR
jgi:hypothetical protein